MTRRVVAVASGGGHWVQLMRLRGAFDEATVTYVSVRNSYRKDVRDDQFFCIRDATRWNKVGLVIMAFQLCWILIRCRPHVVVTTGAAPGYFALRLGRLFGARTIWIDSVANVEEMSMAGRLAQRHADLWLTQWPQVAASGGPTYVGSVLGEVSVSTEEGQS